MCNNSLFDGEWRRKYTGAKQNTEDTNAPTLSRGVVGEHSNCSEGRSVRATGAIRRENVGISNQKSDEKSDPRKSKVSVAMAINHGLGDPKAMARAAADGKPVNIPARLFGSME